MRETRFCSNGMNILVDASLKDLLRQVGLALLLPLLGLFLGLQRVEDELFEAVPDDQGRHGAVEDGLRQNFVRQVDGKRVGLRRAKKLDLERHADRDPDHHRRAQRAVGRHPTLDAVLDHCTERSQPKKVEKDAFYKLFH